MTKICESMERVCYPKGYNVLEIGKIERDVFFIAKGIVRAYTLVDGKEVTFWIGEEGATIVSMMGYVRDQPGYETMELMEDSELYVIKREVLLRLFKEDINIANWGRRFAETELLDAEMRVLPYFFQQRPNVIRTFLILNLIYYNDCHWDVLHRISA